MFSFFESRKIDRIFLSHKSCCKSKFQRLIEMGSTFSRTNNVTYWLLTDSWFINLSDTLWISLESRVFRTSKRRAKARIEAFLDGKRQSVTSTEVCDLLNPGIRTVDTESPPRMLAIPKGLAYEPTPRALLHQESAAAPPQAATPLVESPA